MAEKGMFGDFSGKQAGAMGIQLGLSLYSQYSANEAAVKAADRRLRVATALAAEALSLTYNSILKQSYEAGQAARRTELQIRQQARQRMGAAVAQAAKTGAMGKRVTLSREQAILGGADSALQQLARDSEMSQAALMDRADMEERATINRLVSNTPSLPSSFDPIVTGLGAAVSGYADYLDDKEWDRRRREAAIEK